jgi:hypothetical protein
MPTHSPNIVRSLRPSEHGTANESSLKSFLDLGVLCHRTDRADSLDSFDKIFDKITEYVLAQVARKAGELQFNPSNREENRTGISRLKTTNVRAKSGPACMTVPTDPAIGRRLWLMYEIAKNSVQKLTPPPWPAEPDLSIDQEWGSGGQ